MRYTLLLLSALMMLCLAVKCVAQEEETTLFNSDGTPVAYIAVAEDNEEPTIYLWSGRPVAYLASSSSDGYSIYGFNGKHLGWFVKGIARDHDGDGACGVREVVQSPKAEPFKAFKQFQPFKAFKVFEPFRPVFTQKWSSTSCGLFLSEGAKE
jgi:hypothetical protein